MLQSRIGVCALEAKLNALLLPDEGVVLATSVREICSDMGDVIALQYAQEVFRGHAEIAQQGRRVVLCRPER